MADIANMQRIDENGIPYVVSRKTEDETADETVG